MSTESPTPGFGSSQHPDENQLLLALERELSSAETAEVENHLGTCWECRARYHEMHRGILRFVEYRDKLYLPELESAPHDFRQFPSVLNRTATETGKVGLLDRIRTRFFSFMQVPLQIRWISATAAIVTAVVFWTQIFNPGTLSARELLNKATEAQNSPAKHGQVRQRVRVKTAKSEIVREFQWEMGRPIPNATWEASPENWTAPLTAEGFAQWHDSLIGPRDSVEKSGDRWTMRTTAALGPIKEASIVIRDGDFHPTEQHLRFSDNATLDLEEISFSVVDTPPAAVPVTTQTARPPESPVAPQSQEVVVTPTINLEDVELALRYAVFTHGWDDEDLQIERTTDAVVIGGTASSSERSRAIQAVLDDLQGVNSSISAPSSSPGGAPPRVGSPKAAGSSTVPLLRDRLNEALASSDARRDFVDSCLAASDSALSHAWSLRKLTERYSEADRRGLKPESRAKLDEMLRAHLEQLVAANVTLDGLVSFLPLSRMPRTETPGGRLPGILALFDLVQQQDSVVAALVAGTQSNDSLVTASDRFRSAHEAITRLARELRTTIP